MNPFENEEDKFIEYEFIEYDYNYNIEKNKLKNMTILTKFRDLGLSETMLNSLHKKGFEEPTPIQAKTIPFLLLVSKHRN